MGRLSAPLLALALAAVAATGLSACGGGSSDLLPGTTASEINSNLDEVRQLVSEGDCIGASDAASAVSTQVEELGGVDAKLKEALSEGANRLNEVVAGCEEVPSELEEEEAALEEAERAEEEAEASEKPKKKEKETGKPEKEPTAPAEAPEPPGQEKKEEKGVEEEVPPVEPEPEGGGQSGGVGPGAEVGVE